MAQSKTDVAFKELLSRQEYLVMEANDLAKAFNNLSVRDQKIFDYCVSFIKKDSDKDSIFKFQLSELVRNLGLTKSGTNYANVAASLYSLMDKTSITIKTVTADGVPALTHVPVFIEITIDKLGRVSFQFSPKIVPYLFSLKQEYYSFSLATIGQVKSKYTLILLKLWQSKSIGDAKATTITGTLDEWEQWSLPDNTHWTAGRFNQKVLGVAKHELETLFKAQGITVDINKLYRGRKTEGYELTITGNLKRLKG